MTRIMYDFTHDNVAYMRQHFPNLPMIAFYGTGSPGIDWTDQDRALWPHATMVEIDQGASGSPVPTAAIRDVENGAWTPKSAVDITGWHADRRTIYGSRTSIAACIAEGWRGDVWLAEPNTNPTSAPVIPGVNVVAVQNNWQPNYDASIVFDDTWYPGVVPAPPGGELSVTVAHRTANMFLPGHIGADHYVVMYREESGSVATVIDRPPARTDGTGIHLNNVIIPGSNGGSIVLAAIVNGTPVDMGARNLP